MKAKHKHTLHSLLCIMYQMTQCATRVSNSRSVCLLRLLCSFSVSSQSISLKVSWVWRRRRVAAARPHLRHHRHLPVPAPETVSACFCTSSDAAAPYVHYFQALEVKRTKLFTYQTEGLIQFKAIRPKYLAGHCSFRKGQRSNLNMLVESPHVISHFLAIVIFALSLF